MVFLIALSLLEASSIAGVGAPAKTTLSSSITLNGQTQTVSYRNIHSFLDVHTRLEGLKASHPNLGKTCLFTDWDGTVTEENTLESELRDEAVATIAEMMDEGVEVAVLTAKGGGDLSSSWNYTHYLKNKLETYGSRNLPPVLAEYLGLTHTDFKTLSSSEQAEILKKLADLPPRLQKGELKYQVLGFGVRRQLEHKLEMLYAVPDGQPEVPGQEQVCDSSPHIRANAHTSGRQSYKKTEHYFNYVKREPSVEYGSYYDVHSNTLFAGAPLIFRTEGVSGYDSTKGVGLVEHLAVLGECNTVLFIDDDNHEHPEEHQPRNAYSVYHAFKDAFIKTRDARLKHVKHVEVFKLEPLKPF